MTPSEIQARITEIKEVDLLNVKTAIRSLVTGEHAEYLLDSGQSTQRVKRLSLEELKYYQEYLNDELARLTSMLGASGQIGRAYW